MTKVLDWIGMILWFGSVPVAIYVSVMSYFRTTGSFVRKVGAALCFLVAVMIFTVGSGMAIVFRDGLGPDSRESQGIEALLRSIPEIGFAAFFASIFVAIGWILRTARLPDADTN
jgi:hypothetical protein